MYTSTVAKSVAIACLSIALAPQTAVVPQAVREKPTEYFAQTKSVARSESVDFGELDKYEQSQIEYLIMQIVNSDMNTVEVDGITFTYSDLYYSPTEKAGYVIDFSYGDQCGYMLIASDDNSVTPMEVTLYRQSPYYGKDGLYLYPSAGNYYIVTDSGNILPADQCEINSNRPHKVAITGGSAPVKLEYKYHRGVYHEVYEIKDFNFGYGLNWSVEIPDLDNFCANVAGVISLNYWNNYYDNKLLNLDVNDMYEGSQDIKNEVAKQYLRLFYDYMQTNWFLGFAGGTKPNDCHEGFMRLIRECGYKAEKSVANTYELMRLCFKWNVPVFITSIDYYFSHCIYTMPDFPLKQEENTITFSSDHRYGAANAHTFIGYGCTQLYLYDKEGNLSTIDLIRIADGWGGAQYFHINESDITSAVAIRVLPIPRC